MCLLAMWALLRKTVLYLQANKLLSRDCTSPAILFRRTSFKTNININCRSSFHRIWFRFRESTVKNNLNLHCSLSLSSDCTPFLLNSWLLNSWRHKYNRWRARGDCSVEKLSEGTIYSLIKRPVSPNYTKSNMKIIKLIMTFNCKPETCIYNI